MEETTNIRQFSIDQTFSEAWVLTKKHFLVFLLLTFVMWFVTSIPSCGQYADYMKLLMENGGAITEELEEMLMATASPAAQIKASIASIICSIIQSYFILVLYRLANDAAKGADVNLTHRLKDSIHGFIFYLVTYISVTICIVIGTFACILPGIFLGIRLWFTPVIAALHPERSFGDCFAQSWNMTKGHFWKLLLLGIVLILLNILGLMCCCVGVVVTSIISYFVTIIAYRTLSGEAEEKAEDFTSDNLTIVSE
jgi:hypothetical protein